MQYTKDKNYNSISSFKIIVTLDEDREIDEEREIDEDDSLELTDMKNQRSPKNENEKKQSNFYISLYAPEKYPLPMAFLAAAVFAFITHGFLFANEFFSHDAVSYFTYSDWNLPFYTAMGRFLIPLAETLKGNVAAPWLIGILFTFWMALCTFWTSRLLRIRSRLGIILACGILVTNESLTLLGASYVYCLDEYAFSLALASLAALLFQHKGGRAVWGILPMIASLALYQPYFTVAMALCFLALLRRLTMEGNHQNIIRAGIKQIVLLAVSFSVYYMIWGIMCVFTGATRSRVEESLLSGNLTAIPTLLAEANGSYFQALFHPSILGWWLPFIHTFFLFILFAYLIRFLTDKNRTSGERLLFFILTFLLPLIFRSAVIFLPGAAHDLTLYASELGYFLPLFVFRTGNQGNTTVRTILTILLSLVLWQHIVFANQAYMKKELEKNSTLVLAAEVINRIENTEGYIPGKTPVVIVGRIYENSFLTSRRSGFNDLYELTGEGYNWSATYNFGHYLIDYLRYPLILDTTQGFEKFPKVQNMPVYPAQGSVSMIGNRLVIKLSD